MEVFLPVNTTQTLTIIPRYDSEVVSLTVRNEETDETSVYAIPLTYYSNGYMQIQFAHDFKEGERYALTVVDNLSNLLWRGKAFVTAQTPKDYRINNDIIEI
jgi:hypothetical protein